jgi:hypothetical protein
VKILGVDIGASERDRLLRTIILRLYEQSSEIVAIG